MVNYKNAEDDELAGVVGEKARQVLLQSALEDGYQVYANYALGDEANEVVYGDEPWRQEKLLTLKKRYDPKGVFNAYNPIVYSWDN
jgi:FAD/FMN-containing dehydrogenase